MKIIELLYRFKKETLKKLKAFYNDYFTVNGLYTCLLPDKIYLKKRYEAKTGKKLNLKNPTLFTEKLNWLKLYNRKPVYTIMADKYLVREFVADRIGEDYLVPLLAVYDSAEEIDFDALPNQFVLKCNHDSDVVICKNKQNSDFSCKKCKLSDLDEVKTYLKRRLSLDYYKSGREWPYKNIPRKIICEKYIKNDDNSEPIEYKVFCFGGKPKYINVISGRFFNDEVIIDTYDADWNHTDLIKGNHPRSANSCKRPECFCEIIELSEKLSRNTPFLRVDFNFWNNKLYFGELTFYDSAGFESYQPEGWNERLGNLLILPKKHRR